MKLIYEVKDRLARITINRPEAMNAMDPEVYATIKDLEGLERDARWNRSLGYRGQTVMHPSHVPIVNKVFTPTAEEIAFHQGLIEAMEDAEKKGIAAVTYKGDMVDEAMVKTSREMLAFARAIGLQT